MIGRMRKRLEYQTYTTSSKPNGQETRVWSTLFTTWAAVEPISGREAQQAGQTTATLTHKIRLRYRPTVKPDGRFVLGDRVFQIVSVIPDELNVELVVNALEKAGAGG